MTATVFPPRTGTETFVTDANGKAVFKYLKVGKYKLVEAVPVGYIADGTTEIELTDKPQRGLRPAR